MAFSSTYNASWVSPVRAVTYNSTTGVYTQVQSLTAWDYFQDAIAVGDMIYWTGASTSGGSCGRTFKNIKVYIGTALVADAITIVWEYWNGTAWTSLTVIDNTNNFTNLGERTIEFVVPSDWEPVGVTNVTVVPSFMVRCRVTAVTNPTEGGANSTQTTKVGDNKIVITGSGDFNDLYNTVISHNANFASRPTTDVFLFARFNLDFGDGSTTTVIADSNIYANFKYVDVRNLANSTFTLGAYNSTYDVGQNGGLLFFHAPNQHGTGFYAVGGTLSWYGVTFIGHSTSTMEGATFGVEQRVDVNFYNVAFYGRYKSFSGLPNHVAPNTGVRKVKNCVFSGIGFLTYQPCTIFDNNYCLNNVTVRISGSTATFSHLTTGTITDWTVSGTDTVNLLNCSFTALDSIVQWSTGGRRSIFWVQYLFDLKVIDSNGNPISGATVLADYQDGLGQAFSATTGADGAITQQTINYYKWDRLWTSPTTHTTTITYYANPLTVTISKAGYKTRTIQYTMDRKREEIEMLEPEVPAAPSGLTAIATSRTQINLSWTDNSDNETGFRIERSPNGTTYWTHIATTDANVTAHLDGDLQCGTTYYYRVCAVNDVGLSDYSNVAGTATEACPVPAVVMELESMIP